MKTLIAALIIFGLQSAQAETNAQKVFFSCKLAKLLNDVFEEGLSRHEYPDVTADQDGNKLTFEVGAMLYSKSSGDVVMVKETPTSISVIGIPEEAKRTRDNWTKVTVSKSYGKDGKRWGTIWHKHGEQLIKVGIVVCK